MSHRILNRFGAIVFSAALVAMVGCKKEETNVTTDTATDTTMSSTVSDTTVTSTSSTTDTTMTSTSTDTTMTSTSTASLTSLPDGHFAEEAAMGGMAEVQLGNLAQQKAQSADVKSFGAKMVQDHSAANTEFTNLLSQKGVSAPADLDQEHKDVMTKLSALSGAEFDKAYMKQMVDDHNKDVDLFTTESKDGKDNDMKTWAGAKLATLKEHQTMAKATAKKVGAK